jgi:hypothetical protein
MLALWMLAQTNAPMDSLGAQYALCKLVAVLVGIALWNQLKLKL